MKTIIVENLRREFGKFVAVNDVSFEVARGEVFGFLGANGAGKTTTIRMLIGLLPPTSGSARVAGFDIAREANRVRKSIGYMSQKFSLYDDLTIEENLVLFAGLYDVPKAERPERMRWALETAGVADSAARLTREVPGGYKQRLALAASLMHRPDVLFLDEPTSGADPSSRRRFWQLIGELSAQGTTIMVTSHYMDEVERCHRIALMDRGGIIALGTPPELKRDFLGGNLLEIVVDHPMEAMQFLRGVPGVRSVEIFGAALHVDYQVGAAEIAAQFMRDAGLEVRSCLAITPSVEDVFVNLLRRRQAS